VTIATEPNFVQSYGDGGFRIGGETWRGSVLVLSDAVHPWPVNDFPEITLEAFDPLAGTGVEFVLIGTGETLIDIDPEMRAALRERGLGADVMDTGAACRTFNVLLAENRPVAAALIAVA
jgi:uncharacterized protein